MKNNMNNMVMQQMNKNRQQNHQKSYRKRSDKNKYQKNDRNQRNYKNDHHGNAYGKRENTQINQEQNIRNQFYNGYFPSQSVYPNPYIPYYSQQPQPYSLLMGQNMNLDGNRPQVPGWGLNIPTSGTPPFPAYGPPLGYPAFEQQVGSQDNPYNPMGPQMQPQPVNFIPPHMPDPHKLSIPLQNSSTTPVDTNLQNSSSNNQQPLDSQNDNFNSLTLNSPKKARNFRLKKAKSYQILDEIEEKKHNSQGANSNSSVRGHYYTRSQDTNSQYYSIHSMPTLVAALSDHSGPVQNTPQIHQAKSTGVNTQPWSEQFNSNNSIIDASTGMFLAPPGVQVEADMNTGMSVDELKTTLQGNASEHSGNIFDTSVKSNHLKELADKMKNRKSLFSGLTRNALNSNSGNGDGGNIPKPVISLSIPTENRSPDKKKQSPTKGKNFYRSITMPNAHEHKPEQGGKVEERLDSYICQEDTQGNSSSSKTEQSRRESNFSLPMNLPGSQKTSLWAQNVPSVTNQEATNKRQSNFSLYNPYSISEQNISYPDRRKSQMNKMNITTLQQEDDVPRRSSEFYGNYSQGRPIYKYGNSERKFDMLKAPQEESEFYSVQSSGKSSSLNKVVESINSDDSTSHVANPYMLTAPTKDNKGARSSNLGELSETEKSSEAKCSISQSGEIDRLQKETISNSGDDETDLLKECFAL